MKIFFLKRRALAAIAAVAAVAAMAAVTNLPSAISASATTRQLPIYCVDRDQKMVSISFDAAWGNEDTQQLIDITCPTLFRSVGQVIWDVDSLDWKEISAAEITQRVTEKIQNGSIVLFHNAALHTPEALPGILEYMIGQGYEVVPISEILLTCEYYMDHTGRQCPVES